MPQQGTAWWDGNASPFPIEFISWEGDGTSHDLEQICRHEDDRCSHRGKKMDEQEKASLVHRWEDDYPIGKPQESKDNSEKKLLLLREAMWKVATPIVTTMPKAYEGLYRLDAWGNVVCKEADAHALTGMSVALMFPHARGGLAVEGNTQIMSWYAAHAKADNILAAIVVTESSGGDRRNPLQVGVSLKQFSALWAEAKDEAQYRAVHQLLSTRWYSKAGNEEALAVGRSRLPEAAAASAAALFAPISRLLLDTPPDRIYEVLHGKHSRVRGLDMIDTGRAAAAGSSSREGQQAGGAAAVQVSAATKLNPPEGSHQSTSSMSTAPSRGGAGSLTPAPSKGGGGSLSTAPRYSSLGSDDDDHGNNQDRDEDSYSSDSFDGVDMEDQGVSGSIGSGIVLPRNKQGFCAKGSSTATTTAGRSQSSVEAPLIDGSQSSVEAPLMGPSRLKGLEGSAWSGSRGGEGMGYGGQRELERSISSKGPEPIPSASPLVSTEASTLEAMCHHPGEHGDQSLADAMTSMVADSGGADAGDGGGGASDGDRGGGGGSGASGGHGGDGDASGASGGHSGGDGDASGGHSGDGDGDVSVDVEERRNMSSRGVQLSTGAMSQLSADNPLNTPQNASSPTTDRGLDGASKGTVKARAVAEAQASHPPTQPPSPTTQTPTPTTQTPTPHTQTPTPHTQTPSPHTQTLSPAKAQARAVAEAQASHPPTQPPTPPLQPPTSTTQTPTPLPQPPTPPTQPLSTAVLQARALDEAQASHSPTQPPSPTTQPPTPPTQPLSTAKVQARPLQARALDGVNMADASAWQQAFMTAAAAAVAEVQLSAQAAIQRLEEGVAQALDQLNREKNSLRGRREASASAAVVQTQRIIQQIAGVDESVKIHLIETMKSVGASASSRPPTHVWRETAPSQAPPTVSPAQVRMRKQLEAEAAQHAALVQTTMQTLTSNLAYAAVAPFLATPVNPPPAPVHLHYPLSTPANPRPAPVHLTDPNGPWFQSPEPAVAQAQATQSSHSPPVRTPYLSRGQYSGGESQPHTPVHLTDPNGPWSQSPADGTAVAQAQATQQSNSPPVNTAHLSGGQYSGGGGQHGGGGGQYNGGQGQYSGVGGQHHTPVYLTDPDQPWANTHAASTNTHTGTVQTPTQVASTGAHTGAMQTPTHAASTNSLANSPAQGSSPLSSSAPTLRVTKLDASSSSTTTTHPPTTHPNPHLTTNQPPTLHQPTTHHQPTTNPRSPTVVIPEDNNTLSFTPTRLDLNFDPLETPRASPAAPPKQQALSYPQEAPSGTHSDIPGAINSEAWPFQQQLAHTRREALTDSDDKTSEANSNTDAGPGEHQIISNLGTTTATPQQFTFTPGGCVAAVISTPAHPTSSYTADSALGQRVLFKGTQSPQAYQDYPSPHTSMPHAADSRLTEQRVLFKETQSPQAYQDYLSMHTFAPYAADSRLTDRRVLFKETQCLQAPQDYPSPPTSSPYAADSRLTDRRLLYKGVSGYVDRGNIHATATKLLGPTLPKHQMASLGPAWSHFSHTHDSRQVDAAPSGMKPRSFRRLYSNPAVQHHNLQPAEQPKSSQKSPAPEQQLRMPPMAAWQRSLYGNRGARKLILKTGPVVDT